MQETKDRADPDTAALKAQLAKVTAEWDRLQATADREIRMLHESVDTWIAKVAALETQLEAARAALRVFADRRAWTSLRECNEVSNAVWHGPSEPWKLAQKALEGK